MKSVNVSLQLDLLIAGIASIYGNFDGHQYTKTSNGEIVYPSLATCAHRTAAFGTILLIKNTKNGKEAKCRVNDRGPWKQSRIVDVTPIVARNLEFDGLTTVVVTQQGITPPRK